MNLLPTPVFVTTSPAIGDAAVAELFGGYHRLYSSRRHGQSSATGILDALIVDHEGLGNTWALLATSIRSKVVLPTFAELH